MLGLLIKDFLTLKRYAKTAAFLIAIYAAWGYISDNSMMMVAFFTIFFVMISVTSIAYDDAAHWNNYALTMPVSRTTLVLSKYVLGLLLCLMGMVISLLGTLLLTAVGGTAADLWEIFFITAASAASIGIIFISIYMPFALWLGVEKSRVIMLAIFLVPSILIGALYKIAPGIADKIGEALSILEVNPTHTLIGVASIIILMLVISFLISLMIFRKKEF